MRPDTVAVSGPIPARQPWLQTTMVTLSHGHRHPRPRPRYRRRVGVRQCCARHARNPGLRLDRRPALRVKQGSSYLDSTIRCNKPRRISKIASEGLAGRFGLRVADPDQCFGQQTRRQTIGHDRGSGVSVMMIAPATSAVRNLFKIGDPAMPDPNIDLACGLNREQVVWNDLREMVAAGRDV